MSQFELLEVIEVHIPPKKGWSLASQFATYMFDNYSDPKDPQLLDERVRKLSFKVNGNAHSYHLIVDFMERLPSIISASKIGDIRLVYDFPAPKDASLLAFDIKRVLRSFDRGSVWSNQDGSLLSQECVTDVIKQLHSQLLVRRPIDGNTPRDGRYLLIFDERDIDEETGQPYCQVARWKNGAWRYQHDEYTIDGTHWKNL